MVITVKVISQPTTEKTNQEIIEVAYENRSSYLTPLRTKLVQITNFLKKKIWGNQRKKINNPKAKGKDKIHCTEKKTHQFANLKAEI